MNAYVDEFFDFVGETYPVNDQLRIAQLQPFFGRAQADAVALGPREGYAIDRSFEQVALLHGLTYAQLVESISGKTVLDLCCGQSTFGHEVSTMGATEVSVADIQPKGLIGPGLPEDKKHQLDLSMPIENTSVDQHELTVATYGLPNWACSISHGVTALQNQLLLTVSGGTMMNAPVLHVPVPESIDTFTSTKPDNLDPFVLYRIIMDYHIAKQLQQLQQNGHEVVYRSSPRSGINSAWQPQAVEVHKP